MIEIFLAVISLCVVLIVIETTFIASKVEDFLSYEDCEEEAESTEGK